MHRDTTHGSGRTPGGGSGAYELVYAPNTSSAARTVAESAALDLVCGAPDGSEPSFMQQVALASNVEVDVNAMLADDSLLRCRANPLECSEYVTLRDEGGIGLDSALMQPPALLRSWLCTDACLDRPGCYRPVLDEFLTGAATEDEAMSYALRQSVVATDSGDEAGENFGSNKRRQRKDSHRGVMGVVILPPDLTPASREVSYTIRVNSTDVPRGQLGHRWAQEKFERWVVGENEDWKKYWTYANLQKSFDQAIMRLTLTDSSTALPTPLPLVTLAMSVKGFPYPAYSTNLGSTFAAVFFGLVFVFTFVITVVVIVKGITEEKELRIREGMKIMGLSDLAYWSSWFATSYASLLLVSFLVSLVGMYPFRYTDWTVTLMFLVLWTAQLVTFCFALTTLFSSGKIASICSALIYVVTWVPGVAAVASSPQGSDAWLGACLMMPAGGIYMWGWAVSILENAQEGVQWDNLMVNLFDGDKYTGEKSGTFSAGLIMGVTVANAMGYAALAWYLDQVVPGRYGRPKPPWFLFLPSYWCGSRGRMTGARGSRYAVEPTVNGDEGDKASLPGGVEPELWSTSRIPAVIRVSGMIKRFGSNTAVDSLHFVARQGQITALLGHNGAGKTTTISILTGMIQQDGGGAWVNGMSVERDMKDIRCHLGVCPQFDVLWPQLTVREHLVIYARFRGLPKGDIEAEVEGKLSSMGLASKAGCQAGTLSGGQKRKLSVAIAFIGNPTVVMLDEPTSGMDPQSRRFTWDFIRHFKTNKGVSVLLTTHFMDEADILSDRVAIMSKGKLACVGSPLFLKTEFGVGYHLTVMLKDRGGKEDTDAVSINLAAITDVVLGGIEGASLASHGGRTVVYSLPSNKRSLFPKVLNELEGRSQDLNVESCGVSCSTLEEVFLNVAELVASSSSSSDAERSANLSLHENDDILNVDQPPPATPVLRTGAALYVQQFRGMLLKRMIHARRDKLSLVTMYLVPIVFVIIGLLVSNISSSVSVDPPPAVMDRSYLGDLPTLFAAPDEVLDGPSSSTTAIGEVMHHYPAEDLLPIVESGVQEMWTCWEPSNVADVCRPDSEPCDNCTAAAKIPDTLDGFLMAHVIQQRATCRRVSGPHATCSAIYAGSSRLAAEDRFFNYTVAVSSTAYHALPATMTSFHSAVFAALHPDHLGGATLLAVNHPLPTTTEEKAEQAMLMQLLVSLCIILGLSCLSASASVFLVWERASASKHLQMVSGLHRCIFWAGVYVWDLIASALPLALIFLAFSVCNLDAYGGESLSVIAVALGLFAVSALPLAYVLHWPFENHMACLAGQMGVYFFFGVAQLIAAVVLDGLSTAGVGGAQDAWAAAQWVFRWLPHYNVGRILFNLSNDTLAAGQSKLGPWHADVSSNELLSMAVGAGVFTSVTLAVEYGACDANAWKAIYHRLFDRTSAEAGQSTAAAAADGHEESCHLSGEGIGIKAECLKANDPAAPSAYGLVVRNLRKEYAIRGGSRAGSDKLIKAVKGVNFAVSEGECFGLLGVNGAGKTTTFKMLSGQFPPSSGNATITLHPGTSGSQSYDILTQLARMQQHVGYCPQFDALQGTMTAMDHLLFYGALRGLTPKTAAAAAEALIDRLGIRSHAHLPAGGYSGGTRRKVSVAISLLGDPAVVLLDEPSTGMDPESRRHLWGVLASTTRDRCVVLTSHSMEECEALCHRVGIMVGGRMRCVGPVQALKSAYGEGYTLDLRVPDDANQIQGSGPSSIDTGSLSSTSDSEGAGVGRRRAAVRRFVRDALPDAVLVEEHATRLRYRLPPSATADAFTALESSGRDLGIEDYQLGQTTLEEVFLRFAEQEGQDRGCVHAEK